MLTYPLKDFFPVTDRLDTKGGFPVGSDGALLVNVGGGMGHDLREFKAQFPQMPGKIVLQERPEVIQQIKDTILGVELMEHNFFTGQPIRGKAAPKQRLPRPSNYSVEFAKCVIGARAYYLHSVLHDWDDAKCRQILTNLRPAMHPRFSKLLINELIIPDSGVAWSVTSMDWLMMALGAVRERTASDWVALLESTGFRVVKIWTYEEGTESLIEAEVEQG